MQLERCFRPVWKTQGEEILLPSQGGLHCAERTGADHERQVVSLTGDGNNIRQSTETGKSSPCLVLADMLVRSHPWALGQAVCAGEGGWGAECHN